MNPTALSVEPTIVLGGVFGWGVVAILLAAAFVITRRRPDYGLGLVVAALPLYQVRGELFGLPTTLLELLLLTVLGAVASRWPAYRPVRTPYDLWLGIYVLGALLAVALGPDLRGGFGLWRAFFLEPALWFVAAGAVFRRHPSRALLAGALGTIAVVAVWTAGLLLGSGDLSYDGRLVGPYQSPNYTALLLVPLLLLVALWPGRQWAYGRIAAGGVALAILVASASLGGILALAAGALVAAYALTRRKGLLVAGVAGILVAAAVFGPKVLDPPPPPPTPAYSVDPAHPPPPPHISSRPVLWKEATNLIKENPLFPSAPGQFEETFGKRVEHVEAYRLYVTPYALNPHNLKLSVWVEWGLLTLVGLAGLLIICLVKLVRARPTVAAPLAMLTAIMVHGLVDTPVLKNDLAIIMMLTLVLSLDAKRARPA